MALLRRAMADIPRIEQLEKDHPRMARLFQKGLLPFGIWEQLVDAEAMMDGEVRMPYHAPPAGMVNWEGQLVEGSQGADMG